MNSIDRSKEKANGSVATATQVGQPVGGTGVHPVGWLQTYAFTLDADLTQTFIGEIPSGFRIDLQYDPDRLSVGAASGLDKKLQELLKEGQLLTGTDWVSVTNNGLASFDTRITLRVGSATRNPDKRSVISANIRGRVDLGAARKADGSPIFDSGREAILPRWQKGFDTGAYLPVALSVIFDVPVQGDDDEQNEVYTACRELERGLFVAFGKAVYIEGPNSPLDTIHLDFYKVPLFGEAVPDPVPIDNSSARTVGTT